MSADEKGLIRAVCGRCRWRSKWLARLGAPLEWRCRNPPFLREGLRGPMFCDNILRDRDGNCPHYEAKP